MTSGNFRTVPLSSIIIDREKRQRRELTGIEELAESMRRVGQIHPIVIDENHRLIAGERRYTAATMLGWTSISAQLTSDLSEYELHVIELEENVRRSDLTWQDECLAIKRYHELRASETDAGWTLENTGDALGFTPGYVQKHMLVGNEIAAGNERIITADKFSVALGVATRDKERRATSQADAIAQFMEAVDDGQSGRDPGTGDDDSSAEAGSVSLRANRPVQAPLIQADFHEWCAAYTGLKFNFLHCDFPYGIDLQDSDQAAGQAHGTYADNPDVFWRLLDTLAMGMDNVVADSAHMIFWFSMDFYQLTLDKLRAMGWTVSPFPLIWHKSDNTGILADFRRQPRRTYETAFFCTRGDRYLATGPHGQGPVANSFSAPGKGKELHMNEKPVEMLRHFMRLTVDEHSLVLDPTAGSANSIRAAISLGARFSLGLERDPEFFARAIGAGFSEYEQA